MKEETKIQNEIRIGLSDYGVCFRMNVGLFYTKYGIPTKIGVDGFSDLLFVGDPTYFGKPVIGFLEVKTKTGIPSDEQIAFIAKMTEYGHVAGIVRGLEEAKQLLGVW